MPPLSSSAIVLAAPRINDHRAAASGRSQKGYSPPTFSSFLHHISSFLDPESPDLFLL
jgi:hypothetical protein